MPFQAPLQPLQDNLESQTYETFEKDVTKYACYQAAVEAALRDRVSDSDAAAGAETVLMVVGAGVVPACGAECRCGARMWCRVSRRCATPQRAAHTPISSSATMHTVAVFKIQICCTPPVLKMLLPDTHTPTYAHVLVHSFRYTHTCPLYKSEAAEE